MTVNELILFLQDLDGDMPVYLYETNGWNDGGYFRVQRDNLRYDEVLDRLEIA